ncbi:MAG TPA: ABC-F family ATP-binding cassette domain-containing protein [Syntrophales bacterium]|nr:ABC-F family ATP-binding cassette domain-containing protein [Syntrophales bacterium]
MIQINNISLAFGEKRIFDRLNWFITEKSRIGLVGDNGQGKTTLLRAIMGQVDLDEGSIDIPGKKTFGYLPQDIVELEPLSLIGYFKKRSGIADLEESIGNHEKQIAACPPESEEYEQLLGSYEESMAAFQARDGFSFEARAKQMLKGFGFREEDFAKKCTDFSGGWKMRILLGFILLSRPDIMLLDEPTNHLDTESMEWLENHLRDYQGTLIAISHDRVFLDKLARQIGELENHVLTIYKGNYTYYLREKENRLEALKKEMALQRSEIKKINEFIERFRYKSTKAKQVQSRIRTLEKFDVLKQAEKTKTAAIKFPPCSKSGREVVSLQSLTKQYGDLEVFKNINLTVYRGDKIALVGINGAGKTTLTRIISKEEEPTSGDLHYGLNVKMAFFSQESVKNLDYEKTIWEEVNAAGSKSSDLERRNLLGAFLFSGDDIRKEIKVLSGGEKSRLALLKIMLQDANFLILDEPTNHLDIKTKDIFQNALLHYQGTVLIVSHDRYFLDCLVRRVLEIRQGNLYEYSGNYSYFIEKRREVSAPVPMPAPEDMATEAPQKGRYKTKDEKRREAEARNRLSRMRSDLKKKVSAVEEKVNRLEREKIVKEQELCAPEVCRAPGKIKTLNRELMTISRELEELYENWHGLAQQLDDIDTADVDDSLIN